MATPPNFTDGAVIYASQLDAVGLWKVTTVTGGNGTNSLNVPSAFNADFANYRVYVTGGTIAAATNLRMRLGAAATNYYAGYAAFGYAAAGAAYGNDNGATYWTQVGYCGTVGTSAIIDIFDPYSSTIRTRFATVIPQMVATGGVVFGGGYHNTAASYTDFTISTVSAANWTSDLTVEVFGYN